jgi:ApbE superfamily uncharacterized protein (UPF0280 family)
MRGACALAVAPEDRRLHLQSGPIDLIVEAFAPAQQRDEAYRLANRAFREILPDLVAELRVLRTPIGEIVPAVAGPVARRMIAACAPHRAARVAPMAAVAGAVADHVLAAMTAGADLERAYANNGGDIAVHLEPGQSLSCGVVTDVAAPALDGQIVLRHDMPVRGIATSGRATHGQGGRSFSLGIADAVTVLARDAAGADVCATLIANAVDLPGHAAIERIPASALDPDSDLGERAVTVSVGRLTDAEIDEALERGRQRAQSLARDGFIAGALFALRGRYAVAARGTEIDGLRAFQIKGVKEST